MMVFVQYFYLEAKHFLINNPAILLYAKDYINVQ